MILNMAKSPQLKIPAFKGYEFVTFKGQAALNGHIRL